jgi:MoaA/NifB/PqqE/SkfB family radical SAM enzyme
MNNLIEDISYVYLETTNFCNLDCAFCNRRDVVKKAKHMSLENWDNVLEKLSSQPITEAKLMGLGEPFMHPHFAKICENFRAAFPQAFTIVATNCQYKLNDNFIKSIPFINLLYLSIDGYKENYEKDRRHASWEKLLSFLDELSMIERGKTRIAINYVVTTENYMDISKINELVQKKYPFIEEVRLNIAQWWGEGENCSVDPKSGSSKYMNTLIKYRKNVKGKAPWNYSDCFWPKRGLYMDVKGDLKICCLNTSTKPIGNIFELSLEEIKNNKYRLQVASECNSNKPGKHCMACDYNRLSPVLDEIFKAQV